MLAALVILYIGPLFAIESRPNGLDAEQRRARTAIVRTFTTRATAAIAVAWCESHLRAHAIGGGNVGLFQINYAAHHRPGESWRAFVRRFTQLGVNVAFAFRLSRGGRDWSAWTCQP